MKVKLTIAMPLILAVCSATVFDVGGSQHFRVGLSPFYTPDEARTIKQRRMKFILESDAGSTITMDDAYALRQVARFEVAASRSAAGRARLLAAPIALLNRWLDERRTLPLSISLTNTRAIIRPVEYCDYLASQAQNQGATVVILGAPFALYPNEESFSMTGQRYPSDGNLLCDPSESPYSAVPRANALARAKVYWCYGSDAIWGNDWHKARVHRFWSLFAASVAGQLVMFNPDIDATLSAAKQGLAPTLETFTIDSEDRKVMMRDALPRVVPSWMPRSLETNRPPNALNATTNAVETADIRPAIPPVKIALPAGVSLPRLGIGIMWSLGDRSNPVDLDLWVLPGFGKRQLSYQNTLTDAGRYFFDHQARNDRLDWEIVELKQGVELKAVRAWVNFFAGRANPARGKVCVFYEGRQHLGEFEIPAHSGNNGAGNRENSPFWVELNLGKIMGKMP